MANTAVITIDGPSGSGKGTLSRLLAQQLGWHILDSGAIYRVLALATLHHNINTDDEEAVVPLAANLDVQFQVEHIAKPAAIILEGENVTYTIREEKIGEVASKIAVIPSVREALLRRQRAFRQEPGLVADGRDMGTIVFPKAEVKIFLTAKAEQRALRRLKELQDKKAPADYDKVLLDIKIRDERDTNRTIAPLKPAPDALILDSTTLTIDHVFEQVLQFTHQKLSRNNEQNYFSP